MKYQLRKKNFWFILGVDLLLLVAAHLLAYVIRFDGVVPRDQWDSISAVLVFLLPAKLLVFHLFGVYRGMWRYTSLADLLNLFKACVVSGFIALGAILLLNRFEGFSRSVFVLDALLTFLFIGGFRVSLRLACQTTFCLPFFGEDPGRRQRRKRLLIIGAGDAAEKLTREINDNKGLPYMVAGFLDDRSAKIGQQIHGIPVLGPIGDLAEYAFKVKAQEILIAIPSATRDQMQRIVELCRTCGIPFKTLPGLGELISDKVSIKAIRDVSLKDLLGRPPVRLELEEISGILGGKTVLVTGAGGSIGSELCRQIIRFHPANLILMDAGEENLYKIEMELLHEHDFNRYVPVLGKVQDKGLLESLFGHYQPTVVFHAAAYKHVPMVERNPWEGVYNNIFAAKRLMEVSVRHGVERFVLISTDKAVRPTNVMGATKRMTELLMQGFCEQVESAGGGTRFMAVRFGNVIGSSGSVIPLFKRQIELGGPVTVTDPDMTRYFMSIEEASQLILQAASMGEGGEIFILEMGTPVRIGQMARDLIKLCGKEPDTEIEIIYTGLRPGEKMYEELITEGEGIVATGHEKIMVLRGQGASLEYLRASLDNLKELAVVHDGEGIKGELGRVIPEYTPQASASILPRG
ncbi:MAG: polysaccharide biosynthesis protein [Desulfoarculaceae bacterium]|nr:polysaccharide biosynthesis protein [Desulfoarculaceae bacterium]